jgi:hypothetical protein
MTDDDLGELGFGFGAIAKAFHALLHRFVGVVALLCSTASCIAVARMEKPGSITDPNVLILISLLSIGFFASWAWFKTRDH